MLMCSSDTELLFIIHFVNFEHIINIGKFGMTKLDVHLKNSLH